jgi:hypothetical protein
MHITLAKNVFLNIFSCLKCKFPGCLSCVALDTAFYFLKYMLLFSEVTSGPFLKERVPKKEGQRIVVWSKLA